MKALVGDDAKFDEEFWNADMFKEEGEDDLYSAESGTAAVLFLFYFIFPL